MIVYGIYTDIWEYTYYLYLILNVVPDTEPDSDWHTQDYDDSSWPYAALYNSVGVVVGGQTWTLPSIWSNPHSYHIYCRMNPFQQGGNSYINLYDIYIYIYIDNKY